MADNIKKTYFELKDEAGYAERKKQKKIQVESYYFEPEPKTGLIPDSYETEAESKSEDEIDYLSKADRRWFELARRGIFACPKFGKFWDDDDTKM
jgi:hypothetical protein